jgi:hypothetical protein
MSPASRVAGRTRVPHLAPGAPATGPRLAAAPAPAGAAGARAVVAP